VDATPAAQDDRGPDESGGGGRVRRFLARRRLALSAGGEDGMSTAEYAVGTVAACAFAAVLYRVVTGGSIVSALGDLIETALSTLS
jgi:hypothetical protein